MCRLRVDDYGNAAGDRGQVETVIEREFANDGVGGCINRDVPFLRRAMIMPVIYRDLVVLLRVCTLLELFVNTIAYVVWMH